MDDGFQNPSLAKDFSILVIDARGIGNGCVLPAGPLRAPLDPQLDRASAILFVGDGAPAIEAAARARGLPVFHASLEPDPDAVASLRSQKGARLRRASAIRRNSSRRSRRRDRCAGPARLSAITTATAPPRRAR